jgi:hypothetical protein
MNRVAFVVALLIGGVALAVSGGALAQTETDADTTTTDTEMTTSTTTSMSTGRTVAPSNAAPELDARGIPVLSDPATAPPGVNEPHVIPPGMVVTVNPNQQFAFQSQPATESYPACSRTVTDNCVQAYETGYEDPDCPNLRDPRCPTLRSEEN